MAINANQLNFKAQQAALAETAAQAPLGSAMRQKATSALSSFISDALTANQQKAVPELSYDAAKAALLKNGTFDTISKYGELPTNSEGGATNYNYAPTTAREQEVYDAYRKAGFSDVEAKGILLNIQDESGFVTDITEHAPNVHGTRGQGLLQLTDTAAGQGRRTNYLNWLKANGRDDAWSIQSQADFSFYERNNDEKWAYDKITEANNPYEYAAQYVEYVQRPAKEHRLSRQAKYRSYYQ